MEPFEQERACVQFVWRRMQRQKCSFPHAGISAALSVPISDSQIYQDITGFVLLPKLRKNSLDLIYVLRGLKNFLYSYILEKTYLRSILEGEGFNW